MGVGDVLYSWVVNIVKILVLLKLMYIFSAIPIPTKKSKQNL